MTSPVRASDRDLRALASLVSEPRPDVPEGGGLPPSLLVDLMAQIPCDAIGFAGFDSAREHTWFLQQIPWFMPFIPDRGSAVVTDVDPVQWAHYWNCQACSYPDRSGDLRSVVGISDFYSARQWRNVGTRCGVSRPLGFAHDLMLTLPAAPSSPGRTLRLLLFRGSGADFTDRDRALLTLLRPHLQQALRDAERSRHPTPALTARQRTLLQFVAVGHTNAQIARRLNISEGTVRTHLKNIYQRLDVSNRTAAVTHALSDPDAITAATPGGPTPHRSSKQPTRRTRADSARRLRYPRAAG
jgi:DNA-binding CsgD family transcriptional regulator